MARKVFVAGALQGERVRFQRRKRRRNYDEAELLEVLQASPQRIAPRCEVFGVCGGCSLQHISDDEQRQIKQQTLKDNLSRIGNVEPRRWLDPLYGQCRTMAAGTIDGERGLPSKTFPPRAGFWSDFASDTLHS